MSVWKRLGLGRRARGQGVSGLQASAQPWQATHRHRKGGAYRVLAHGMLEADRCEAVIYDDEDGQIWIRSKTEFYDGRFVKIHANVKA